MPKSLLQGMMQFAMEKLRRLGSLFTFRRVIVVVAVLVIALTGIGFLRTMGTSITSEQVRNLLAELGIWGPLALIGSLATVLVIPIIPASIFQIGAGLAFGPLPGLLYASLADILGASIGYWLARRWGNALLTRWLSDKNRETLTRLAQHMNWRTVMLLRLIPGPAYPLVSFAAGYAPVGYGAYLAGSFAGVFPALVLLVFAGDLVTSSPFLAFGLVVALVASMAILGHWINTRTAETTE
ncbi:MAG: TVP38/TMEM64 family protein [Acidobacteriota bacterium]